MPDIQIHSLDGSSFDAYCALPPNGRGPGLLLIKGLFSQHDGVAKLADSYATLGYVVIAPNIFHRQTGVITAESDQNEEPDWERALKLYKSFDVEAGARDLLASLAALRKMPGCSGKVGAIGYCLGCRLAYLMASRSDIDCTVGFYGVGIDSLLDEAFDIHSPLLIHFGENDKLMPPSARQKILRVFAKNDWIVSHTYEGAEHGFVRETSPTYNATHATLANERTQAFLKTYLKD